MLSREQGVPMDHVAVALEKENEYLPLIAQVEPVNDRQAWTGVLPVRK